MMRSSDWDEQASTFDLEPDHSLLDPRTRRAWADLLLPLMPTLPASVVDLGCGTGSLAVLLAEVGYDVVGIDFSRQMVAAARAKAELAGLTVRFERGDAGAPSLSPCSHDVVLARHVLWALPDPAGALRQWVALLKPQGILLLVEGRWSTGAGLTAEEAARLVTPLRKEVVVRRLDDSSLWGRAIEDERYLLFSSR